MGLEPTTPCVTGRYSNQLSYNPKAGEEGFEPPTNALEVRGSIQLSYSPSRVHCSLLRLTKFSGGRMFLVTTGLGLAH